MRRRRSSKFYGFMLCAPRSCVHDLFHCNEMPTVEKITDKSSNRITEVRCSLQRLLAEISFKHEKRRRTQLSTEMTSPIGRITAFVTCSATGRKAQRSPGRDMGVTAGHTRSNVWTDTVVQKCRRLYPQANGLLTGLKQPSGKDQ